jgi:phage terminase small subunit
MAEKKPSKGPPKRTKNRETLSDRELRFAEHFAATGKGNEAARLAGYSAATPQMAVHRLLSRPLVREAIRRFRQEQATAAGISPEFVHSVLKREAVSAANARDRIRAAELLGKAQAMFVDRHEVDGAMSPEARRARVLAIIQEGLQRAKAASAAPAAGQVGEP